MGGLIWLPNSINRDQCFPNICFSIFMLLLDFFIVEGASTFGKYLCARISDLGIHATPLWGALI